MWCLFSAPLRLGGRWLSLLYSGVSVFPRHEGLRSEENDRGEFVAGHEKSFPQRRRDAERFALWCFFSAPLRLGGRSPTLLRRGIPVSPPHWGPRSEEECAEFVVDHGVSFPQRRGDAERFAAGSFLRASAPRREIAYIIAPRNSCFTPAPGAAIGGGVRRVRGRVWGKLPAETRRRLLNGAVSLRLGASAGDRLHYCAAEFLFHCGTGGRDRRRSAPSSWSVVG